MLPSYFLEIKISQINIFPVILSGKNGGGVKNECRSRRPYKYFPLFYIKSSLLAGKTVFNLKMRNVHKQYALYIHKKLMILNTKILLRHSK